MANELPEIPYQSVVITPNADGAHTAWTRSAGSNDYEPIDADDSNYLYSTASGQLSTFTFTSAGLSNPTLATKKDIIGIRIRVSARSNNSGAFSVAVTRPSADPGFSVCSFPRWTSFRPEGDYSEHTIWLANNPFKSIISQDMSWGTALSAWGIPSGIEIGVRSDNAREVRINYIFVDVFYRTATNFDDLSRSNKLETLQFLEIEGIPQIFTDRPFHQAQDPSYGAYWFGHDRKPVYGAMKTASAVRSGKVDRAKGVIEPSGATVTLNDIDRVEYETNIEVLPIHPRDGALVAHWTLAEQFNTNDAFDFGPYAYKMANQGGNPGVEAHMRGQLTAPNGYGARTFTGAANERFQLGDQSELQLQTFTIALWIRPAASPNQQYGNIFVKEYAGSATIYVGVRGGTAPYDRTEFSMQYTDATFGFTYGNAYVANEWRHTVCTWDGTTMRLYEDGVEVDTDASGSGKTVRWDANAWVIGQNRVTAAQYFNGRIADIAYYNEAKSATWVADQYNYATNYKRNFEYNDGGVISKLLATGDQDNITRTRMADSSAHNEITGLQPRDSVPNYGDTAIVTSTTGFETANTANAIAYIGKEAIFYDTSNATSISGLGRGLFGSLNAEHPQNPITGVYPEVSMDPIGLNGRWCRIWTVPVDPETGYPLPLHYAQARLFVINSFSQELSRGNNSYQLYLAPGEQMLRQSLPGTATAQLQKYNVSRSNAGGHGIDIRVVASDDVAFARWKAVTDPNVSGAMDISEIDSFEKLLDELLDYANYTEIRSNNEDFGLIFWQWQAGRYGALAISSSDRNDSNVMYNYEIRLLGDMGLILGYNEEIGASNSTPLEAANQSDIEAIYAAATATDAEHYAYTRIFQPRDYPCSTMISPDAFAINCTSNSGLDDFGKVASATIYRGEIYADILVEDKNDNQLEFRKKFETASWSQSGGNSSIAVASVAESRMATREKKKPCFARVGQGPPIVKLFVNAQGVDAGSLLLWLLRSTGYATNGSYDIFPKGFGLNIRSELIDEQSFIEYDRASGSWGSRSHKILPGDSANKIIEDEFRLPTGYYFGQDEQGRFAAIKQTPSRTLSDSETESILNENVVSNTPISVRFDTSKVINKVVLRCGYDIKDKKYTVTLVAQEPNSIERFGEKPITLEHKGLTIRDIGSESDFGESPYSFFSAMAQGLFHRFAFEQPEITMTVNQVGASLTPGQVVKLSVDDVINFRDRTGKGISGQLAEVVSVNKDSVKGVHEVKLGYDNIEQRAAGYAPTARITAWDATNSIITVNTNVFSTGAPTKVNEEFFEDDASYFTAGDKCIIIALSEKSETPTVDYVTIDSVSASTSNITLDGATVSITPAAGDIIVFDDYSNATTSQKNKEYMQLSNSDNVIAASVEGYKVTI